MSIRYLFICEVSPHPQPEISMKDKQSLSSQINSVNYFDILIDSFILFVLVVDRRRNILVKNIAD